MTKTVTRLFQSQILGNLAGCFYGQRTVLRRLYPPGPSNMYAFEFCGFHPGFGSFTDQTAFEFCQGCHEMENKPSTCRSRIDIFHHGMEFDAAIAQFAHKRDTQMLERGDISQAELRRKKGMLQSMEKVRIVAIGDRNYEDID